MTVNFLMGDILLPVSSGKAQHKAVVECRRALGDRQGRRGLWLEEGEPRVVTDTWLQREARRRVYLQLVGPSALTYGGVCRENLGGNNPGLLKTPERVSRPGLLAPSCLGAVSAITGTAAI